MLNQFLDPKNDLAFRRIFGTERNKDILIHFLNDIFARTTNPIESVTFLRTMQAPEIQALRASIVDVMCEDAERNRFIIEMQIESEPGFAKRAQYYAAKTYIEQRERGVKYQDLKEVTMLCITSFSLFPETKAYLSHHVILDKETRVQQLKDFSFSFLELAKFHKIKDQLVTMVEKWAYFFKYSARTSELDLKELVGADRIMERAYHELSRFAWTPEDLMEYDAIEMKRAADQAIKEGVIAESKAEGKAEGEKTALIRTIKNLQAKGYAMDVIQAATELSLDEIHLILNTP